MKMKVPQSTLWTVVIVGFLFVLWILLPGDQTPETRIWITNNSSQQPEVTIEYVSAVCPGGCLIEMGKFAINEGRGTAFANPNEGSFTVTAEFSGGRKLTQEVENIKAVQIGPIIWEDRIEIS